MRLKRGGFWGEGGCVDMIDLAHDKESGGVLCVR